MKQFISSRWNRLLEIFAACCIAGCGSVTDTVYLDDLSVRGPIAQPPVHLTGHPTEGAFHVSPRFSLIPRGTLDSRIEGNVSPYTNVQPGQDNFHWSMPPAQYGVDCDWRVSNGFALSFGLSYAATSAQEFWGGNGAIGLPFTGEALSGRFDIGMQVQNMWYDAHSVVVREQTSFFSSNTSTSVYYFHDINRVRPWNVYAAFTLNSHSDGLINFFASVSVSRQTLTDFEPSQVDVYGPLGDYHHTDTRVNQSVTFSFFTPGLAITINPTVKMLMGARLIVPSGLGGQLPTRVAPLFQIDVTL
jgi:hypothetical protein